MRKIELEDRIEYRDELGMLHSYDDMPAVEYFNGDKFWMQHGVKHREDGPAEKWSIGFNVWALNGKSFLSEEIFQNALIELKLNRLKDI